MEDDSRGVYPPREDTELLRPFAQGVAGLSVLEIGTGNGLIALTAARGGARVVATDLNRTALRRLADRARAERLELTPVRTDLARGLGRFDRILANPPYLPTPHDASDPDPMDRLALDGGPDGCWVTARLFAEGWPGHLRPDGEAFLLVSSEQDPLRLQALFRAWTGRGGRVETVAERTIEGETLSVVRIRAPPTTRG